MSLTVAALAPVAGSPEAAQLVLDAIVNLKQHAQAELAAVKTQHAARLTTTQRQAAADLAALKATHDKAIAELTAKATAEIAELRRQLATAREAAAELPTLRQRLHSCAYASQLLATAVKPD